MDQRTYRFPLQRRFECRLYAAYESMGNETVNVFRIVNTININANFSIITILFELLLFAAYLRLKSK
jgi:hypothetical protein